MFQQAITGLLNGTLLTILGRDQQEHIKKNWRALLKALDNSELWPADFRGLETL